MVKCVYIFFYSGKTTIFIFHNFFPELPTLSRRLTKKNPTDKKMAATAVEPAFLVMLTVPHSTCPEFPRTGHPCDYAAQTSATHLKKALERAGLPCELFVADVPRGTSDMNREESRGSKWRERIERRMASGRVVLVLDVHSFPDLPDDDPRDVFKGRSLVTMRLAEWTAADIKFSEPDEAVAWQKQLATKVQQDTQLPTAATLGSRVNDIMLQAFDHGLPSALLEFSERLDHRQLPVVCRSIAEFIVAMLRRSLPAAEVRSTTDMAHSLF